MDELLTAEQAAERLGMSPRYVRRLATERRVAFHRLGRSIRFLAKDLEEYVAAARVEPMTEADVWRDIHRVVRHGKP